MNRLDRQTFLGPRSDATLLAATIGIVGLGGGGSHVAQQLAHLGVGGFVNVDPDSIEDTNTNRLIGGTLADVEEKLAKVAIAERQIRGVQPTARILSLVARWQDAVDDLKMCEVIVGAVDGFAEREQLERFARRHLIPYVDIGMDVHETEPGRYLVSGQTILSMPGAPCLQCCGFITEERLAQEAQRYGSAGARPQVVWSNGVLASTAVGLITQLLTPWLASPPRFAYLNYDGNRGTLSVNPRVELLKAHQCPHHPSNETGDPLFDIRSQKFASRPIASQVDGSLVESWWQKVLRRLWA